MSSLVSETFKAIPKNQYRSTSSLEQQIGELLVNVLAYLNAGNASIIIYQVGSLDVNLKSRRFKFECPQAQIKCNPVNSNSKPQLNGNFRNISNKPLVIPISYASKKLACLFIQLGHKTCRSGYSKFLAMLANKLKIIIMRDRIRCMTKNKFSKELFLIGQSEVSHNLELMIESASDSELPVVLNGEVGSEFVHVACAIHFSSNRANKPFVEVDCQTLTCEYADLNPADWFNRAQGGTLYLNQVDLLGQKIQRRLSSLIEPVTCQRLGSMHRSDQPKTRIIVSTTQDLTKLVEQKKFTYCLYAELNFLRITLPPIRHRGSDIVSLIDYFLSMHSKDEKKTLSKRALFSLAQYNWPGNYTELQQVVAHMSTMNRSGRIGLSDIEAYAPHCLTQNALEDIVDTTSDNTKNARKTNPKTESKDQILALKLLANENSFLTALHPSLRKALVHIKDNYQEHLSLPVLASHACISASHLCYLFRTELDTTFKSLLGSIRIEQAKQLLSGDTNDAITKISLDVGFRDLSHFERTFRRLVGLNPREFKRISSSTEDTGQNHKD